MDLYECPRCGYPRRERGKACPRDGCDKFVFEQFQLKPVERQLGCLGFAFLFLLSVVLAIYSLPA